MYQPSCFPFFSSFYETNPPPWLLPASVDLKSVKIREAVAAHDAAIKSLCYLASEGKI